MKVLITGSSGMLGTALCEALSEGASYKTIGLDSAERPDHYAAPGSFVNCSIADYPRVVETIKGLEPDVIIHAAAYTDVDGCELYPDKAETVNAMGTRYVAEAARESGAALIFISTDYVFDGEKRSPYKEEDEPNPLSVYGRSKLEGEGFASEIMQGRVFFIVRTSWMFGPGGRNFVDAILTKARAEKSLKVVSDQFGSPTYAPDLARAIRNILERMADWKSICGIYHITNSDDCSWYRLAQKALELANIRDVELIPTISEELDYPAARPALSILDNSRYIGLFGRPLRRWDKALDEYIALRSRQNV